MIFMVLGAWFREGGRELPMGWKANLLGRVRYRVRVDEAKEVEQQACMQIIYWRWGWIALSLGCFCHCLGTERGMCVCVGMILLLALHGWVICHE